MNAAFKLLTVLMPNANWELFAAVATVLAVSFALCFLGMLARLLNPEDQLDADEAAELEALQESNGARVFRKSA